MTSKLLSLILPCLGVAAAPAAPMVPAAQTPPADTAAATPQSKTEAEVLYARLFAEYRDAKIKMDAEVERSSKADDEDSAEADARFNVLFGKRNAAVAKLVEGAVTYAGTEGAVPFLMWRVMDRPLGPADAAAASAALATIQKTHIKSPKLKDMLPLLVTMNSRFSAAEVASFMAALQEHSSVPELKSLAKYMLLLKALGDEAYGTGAYEKLAKETLAAAKATGEERTVKEVERAIEFASKFSMGMVSPDIVGVDLSGEAFKLSDYEGKVVFLDFWGDW